MPALPIHLLRRDDMSDDSDGVLGAPFSPTVTALLVALLGLVILGTLCVGALVVLRNLRRARAARALAHGSSLPGVPGGMRQRPGAPQAISISEKQGFLARSGEPESPVPEIRITFPDEKHDGTAGGPGAGRVVVVKIADSGAVGMAPYAEPAPPYSAAAGNAPRGNGFQSLDLERMGGLKEGGNAPQYR